MRANRATNTQRCSAACLGIASSIALVLTASMSIAEPAGWSMGGGPLDAQGERPACISPEQRAAVEEEIRQFLEDHPEHATVRGGLGPSIYTFFPLGGTVYQDLWGNNFVDLDPTAGILDWDCTNFTYNGHQGHDVGLRSFGEQVIGVPIYAALDGTVMATNDGEPDMNTVWNNQTANYVIINHGSGQIGYYWHMKNGSVAVNPGQTVKAGQQIGLVASSGVSTGPHLHFETATGAGVLEPFTGACNPGDSGWTDQIPIRRDMFARDVGVTHEDLASHPGLPFELPADGQLALTDSVFYFWVRMHNISAFASWGLRMQRENGTSLSLGSGNFNNPDPYRVSWWWWSRSVTEMQTTPGVYTIILSIDGEDVASAPVEVRPERTPDFNRAPADVTVALDPPMPEFGDVVFCRVTADLLLDDPDFDIVRFNYRWEVDGQTVRDVVTAGHADALQWDLLSPGGLVECFVTPSDGALTASTVSASSMPPPICDADLNGDGMVGSGDLAILVGSWGPNPGHPADFDGNGSVGALDLATLIGTWGPCP